MARDRPGNYQRGPSLYLRGSRPRRRNGTWQQGNESIVVSERKDYPRPPAHGYACTICGCRPAWYAVPPSYYCGEHRQQAYAAAEKRWTGRRDDE